MAAPTPDFPRISVLIPTYNRSHYLVEAVESALSQDYSNFEVIVSDNASTDGTGEAVRKYLADPRFRYFRNGKNLGSGPNYRRLLYEYATGRFAHYLTDDDYFIDTGHLSKAARIIREHGVKTVFSGAESRKEGEKTGRSLSQGLEEAVPRSWWLENLCRTRRGLVVFPSCGSGILFEAAMARELKAFEGAPYGDYEFALQCILADPRTGYIKEPQYVERRHEGQDGRTSYEHAFQGTRIFDRLQGYGIGMGLDPGALAGFRFRGLRYFARAFLLPNWVRENGNSLSSLRSFLRELARFDSRLPRAVLLDPNTMVQYVFYESPVYSLLKAIYLRYRAYFSPARG